MRCERGFALTEGRRGHYRDTGGYCHLSPQSTNVLLQVAATTGLLGLAAYLWVFVSYFRNACRSGGWPLLALSGGVLVYILQL